MSRFEIRVILSEVDYSKKNVILSTLLLMRGLEIRVALSKVAYSKNNDSFYFAFDERIWNQSNLK